MSTEMTLEILSRSSSETEQLGRQLGQNLKGHEVIELRSDLGGGKTTFVRGLASGMGSSDHVASPSFTIIREYHSPKLTLKHLDFHRLDDGGVVKHELAEAIEDKKTAVAIEWADTVNDILPSERLTVAIKNKGESDRELEFSCPPQLKYLLKGLNNADSDN